jgi:DNA-binding LacI/PurR family transcriptional regulator
MTEQIAKGTSKAPTLYDVANAAGVSHQTVSRVVKGQTNIRADLRERIELAIDELGYRPNLAARSLATSKSHRIGALVYEFLEIGPSRFIKGANDEARDAGYLLDIVSLDALDEHAVERSIALINPQELAGLIVFAPSDSVVATIDKFGFSIPVHIEYGRHNELRDAPVFREIRAVQLILDHLVSLGHRRFFHVTGPQEWNVARTRATAYLAELESRQAHSVGSIAGDWTAESGYRAGMAIPLDEGITAVVAGNDQTALGVMAALADRGVAIPKQISVVGIDDIAEARFFRPALTTVRLDFEQQGRTAMHQLLGAIESGEEGEPLREREPQLVVRASTGLARP